MDTAALAGEMVVGSPPGDHKQEGRVMDHETAIVLLQSCWDAAWALGPAFLLALATWGAAR